MTAVVVAFASGAGAAYLAAWLLLIRPLRTQNEELARELDYYTANLPEHVAQYVAAAERDGRVIR